MCQFLWCSMDDTARYMWMCEHQRVISTGITRLIFLDSALEVLQSITSCKSYLANFRNSASYTLIQWYNTCSRSQQTIPVEMTGKVQSNCKLGTFEILNSPLSWAKLPSFCSFQKFTQPFPSNHQVLNRLGFSSQHYLIDYRRLYQPLLLPKTRTSDSKDCEF